MNASRARLSFFNLRHANSWILVQLQKVKSAGKMPSSGGVTKHLLQRPDSAFDCWATLYFISAKRGGGAPCVGSGRRA